MPNIDKSARIQTVINTFEVSPFNCQELLERLVAINRVFRDSQPGFMSSSIHVNDARTRIANYAQWRSREDFQAMLRNEELRPMIREATDLADRFEPVLYEVHDTVDAVV